MPKKAKRPSPNPLLSAPHQQAAAPTIHSHSSSNSKNSSNNCCTVLLQMCICARVCGTAIRKCSCVNKSLGNFLNSEGFSTYSIGKFIFLYQYFSCAEPVEASSTNHPHGCSRYTLHEGRRIENKEVLGISSVNRLRHNCFGKTQLRPVIHAAIINARRLQMEMAQYENGFSAALDAWKQRQAQTVCR